SVLRVLGVDVLVFGSDRPYAQPTRDLGVGDAVIHAIRVTNPVRLLHGDRPLPEGRDLTLQQQERSDRDDHLVAARTVSRQARAGSARREAGREPGVVEWPGCLLRGAPALRLDPPRRVRGHLADLLVPRE